MKKRRIKQITKTFTKQQEKKRGVLFRVGVNCSKKLGEVVSQQDKYSIYKKEVFM